MDAKREFLQRELGFCRIQRRTRNPEELHLVAPAVEREREILAELERIERALAERQPAQSQEVAA